MQAKEQKMVKKIDRLRNDKLSIGSLMRIVRANKYENLTNDLVEVEKLKKRIPKIKNFVGHF